MTRAPVKLVTIVAEAVLRERLAELVLGAGASGYTLSDATGQGSRARRSTTVLDGENVRLEALASDEVAERVLEVLAREYFPHYAVVAWIADVEVVRGGKFGSRVT